jgi:curved DNA-binding protein CbpA
MTYDPADDLYARIGVAPDAPVTTIKGAYRILIVKVHPDIHGAVGHAATLRLNEAWDILGDTTKRASYDAARKRHFAGQARPVSAPETTQAPPADGPQPGKGRRRAQRPRGGARKAAPRARRAPNPDFDWSAHIRPHPTKPGYSQVDQEAIAQAISLIADLVEKWIKQRRAS